MEFFKVLLIVVFILQLPIFANGETVTQQTGVASPQSESERNNIELLRQRALRNAMDLAVLQVGGAVISGERQSSFRSREDFSSDGEVVDEKIKFQGRLKNTVSTRSEGYARLVEIIKEWREDGQYFVTAKVAVENDEEKSIKKNVGYYWRQAGAPPIYVTFSEEHNGEKTAENISRTFQYFKDNLSKNGIALSDFSLATYRINVSQSLQSSLMGEFDTVTAHCLLSYQIIDVERAKILAEAKASHGPSAGFNFEQAKVSCLQAIAEDLNKGLLRKLAEIMNQRVNNGVERNVKIFSLPGDVVPRANEIIRNLYRVAASAPSRYENGEYTKYLNFKGSGAELADALSLAFGDEDWKITVKSISENQVEFEWLDIE